MLDLFRRLVSSSVLILILFLLLYFAFQPLLQYFVSLIIASFACIAIWEYVQLVKAKGSHPSVFLLIPLGLVQVLSFSFATQCSQCNSLPIFVFFLNFFILFAAHFKETQDAIVKLATSFFALLYIAVPMGMVLGVLYMRDLDGRWWIAYLLIVTKITDIGGYVAGNLMGRHKLAPHISPKKTIEGGVLGLCFALLSSYLFVTFG